MRRSADGVSDASRGAPSNNGVQLTALRAAADAENVRPLRPSLNDFLTVKFALNAPGRMLMGTAL